MSKKILLPLIFFILVMSRNVYGDTKNNEFPKLFFFENNISQDELKEGSILFFSYCKFEEDIDKNIYSFFSNMDIESEIDGDLYSFFSNIRINETGFINSVNTFSSQTTYYNKDIKIDSYLKNIDFIIREDKLGNYNVHNDSIPKAITFLIWVVVKLFICFTLLAIKKGFFSQGAVMIKHQKADIMKNGIIIFLIMIFFAIFFTITLVGIPITIIIILIMLILSMIGEVSAGLYLGNKLAKFLKTKSVYVMMVMGVTILELLTILPVIGTVAIFAIYPVIYQGISVTNIINYFFYKSYYEASFCIEENEIGKDRANMRDIIRKNLD